MAFVLAVVASIVSGSTPAVAQVQVPATANIAVRDGSQPGEVIISWDAVPQATHYRIGYVNMEVDYHFAKASCTEEWIEAFVYVDVNARNIPVNNGRAEYTVRRLATGARHAFTVLTSNNFYNNRENAGGDFSWPQNPRWKFLQGRDTLPPGVTIPTPDCSAAAVAQVQVPATANIAVRDGSQPGEVIISWDAVPQATHYRIGYVNMEVDYHFAKASCTEEWIEAFVYVDVNARNIPVNNGRAEYTVRRLATGARHAFTVLTSNNFYNNRENAGGDFSWPQNPRWKFLQGRDTLPPGVTIPTPDCSAAPGTPTNPAPAADRAALVGLYNATGGASWTDNTNWLSDAPIGDWHGVTTDNTGRITTLLLEGNNLNGRIPAAVGNLTNLQQLYLQENLLEGRIPTQLGNLSQLRTLLLYDNRLTGEMPSSLGNLSNLERFSVRDNQLGGEIPPWLGNLTTLELLRLDRNEFTGPIPPELGRLSNLTHLVLGGNKINGSIPSWLGDLTSLEVLVLDNSGLTEAIPSQLANLTNLKILILNDNRLNGNVPGWLVHLNKLTRLQLAGNLLTGCVPASLQSVETNDFDRLGLPFCRVTLNAATDRAALIVFYNATGGTNWNNRSGWLSSAQIGQWHGVTTNDDGRVTELRLRENGLTGQLPGALGILSSLNYLNLGDNALEGTIPAELQILSNLQQFYLWNNRLTGPVPAWLGNLTNLKRLGLSRNQLKGTIPGTLGNLSNLNLINFGGNQLSGPIPMELQNLGNLQELNLWDNQLTGSVPSWLGSLGNLTRLNLRGNQLSGEIPESLGNLSDLIQLNLSDNRLSGEIPTSLANLANLERLSLYGDHHQFTGCIPQALQRVAETDLNNLNIPICGAATVVLTYTTEQDPVVPYLTWEIGDDMPQDRREAARRGILLMHNYATNLGLPDIDVLTKYYLFHNEKAVNQAYARLKRLTEEQAAEHIKRWNIFGEAGYGFIFINGARIDPDNLSNVQLTSTSAHELAHVHQYGSNDLGNIPTPHDTVRLNGPAWLIEGGATFQAARAMAQGGVIRYADSRARFVRQANQIADTLTLPDLETYNGLRPVSGGSSFSALAVELLVSLSSERAFVDYWTELGPETTWEQAFEITFGVNVNDFYTLYTNHRGNDFPALADPSANP